MYRSTISGNSQQFEYGAFNMWWIIKENNLNQGFLNFNNMAIVASVLFFGYMIFILLANFYRLKGERLFFIAAMLCFAFYMLPIGVHERYLFPFFPIFLIYLVKNKKYIIPYVMLSIIFFLDIDRSMRFFTFLEFLNTNVVGTILSLINMVIFGYLTYEVVKGGKLPRWKDLWGFLKENNKVAKLEPTP
jgi:hypothetical protein